MQRQTSANTSLTVLFEGGRTVDVIAQTSEYSRWVLSPGG